MPLQHLPTGIDLYYETHGSGEPLVLLTSTAFPSDVWHLFQVPELSRSLQVIVLDQRGSGRSSRPKSIYSMDQMGCDVVSLLDHLGIESAHVLGHSMGGRIGLAMALTYPDRVKSLILAASGSGVAAYPSPACVPGLPETFVRGVVEMGLEGYVRHEVFETGTLFTDDFRARHPDRVQQLWDAAWPQHSGLVEFLQLCTARHTWEATHRLGDVQAPTLVVIGDQDTVGRSHVPQAQTLAERIPGARLKVLPGQTHGFFWQEPEETNAWILEWVREHATAGGTVQPALSGSHAH